MMYRSLLCTPQESHQPISLQSRAGLRILVMFRFNYTDKEIIEKIRPGLREFDEDKGSNVLVLILPVYFKWEKPFEKLSALLFDSKGQILSVGADNLSICGFL